MAEFKSIARLKQLIESFKSILAEKGVDTNNDNTLSNLINKVNSIEQMGEKEAVAISICKNLFENQNEIFWDWNEYDDGASSEIFLLDGIEHFNIPNYVSYILGNAFRECNSLKKLTLPTIDNFDIGKRAFYGCENLEEINFPNGVNYLSIGDSAFYNCNSLKKLTFGNGIIQEIGEEAFCASAIETINFPDVIINCDPSAFQETPWYDNNYSGGDYDEPIYVGKTLWQYNGDTVTTLYASGIKSNTLCISKKAFSGRNETKIYIPDKIKYIGDYAFNYCRKLTGIYLPDNPELSIGYNIFYGCSLLSDIFIPQGFNSNNLNLSPSTNFTADTITNSVFKKLADLTGQKSKRVVLGTTNLNKLTADQKAIATNKNWTLS